MKPFTLFLSLMIPLTVPMSAIADASDDERSDVARTETVEVDSPRTLPSGHGLMVPAGWSIRSTSSAIELSPPDAGARIAFMESTEATADAAVAEAWRRLDRSPRWPLKQASDFPPRNGWTEIRAYRYDTPADARRTVFAQALRHGDRWTVVVADLGHAAESMRGAEIGMIFGRLFASGHTAETFAGRIAHPLNDKRLATLTQFVEHARKTLDIPGVALGIVQNDKVVFAGGFGVRRLGKRARVDADTMFLTASITKPLTTLMLAKLVDAGRFTWDTPVTEVMPSFRIGDAETTRQVRIKHLICACTGMPRQDFEWEFASEGLTPDIVMERLASMQPTAAFGAQYQYSNTMAAAGGFVGGYAFDPESELGSGYDSAMQSLVFDPLRMNITTFDFDKAMRGNYAAPHGVDFEGRTVRSGMGYNRTSIPMRPDGGAWSNIHDLLRYVRMELRSGLLPDDSRYIGEAALLARRESQVSRGVDQGYGMGLKLNRDKGTLVAWHGGAMAGYQTEFMFLPEHHVGLVLLVNADAGSHLRGLVGRRFLELLFDATPEAEATLESLKVRIKQSATTERSGLVNPAEPALAATLAKRYHSIELGDIDVVTRNGTVRFDFGDWHSDVATRKDTDGTVLFVTVSPSVAGLEFAVGRTGKKHTLLLRDEMREYVFVAE